jgi:catechol 2,3-dioxygenase-like lactoylglutathione lyase family enzyme
VVPSNSSGIHIQSLNQVGIVVNDVEKTVKDYWRVLGIGPWHILVLRPPQISDLSYHGQPTYFEIKRAITQVGSVQLELMETFKGVTAYTDFAAEHGEGLHHLQYLVDSLSILDKDVGVMKQSGFPSLMRARRDDGGFEYLDTSSGLKAVWEICKMPDAPSVSEVSYPTGDGEVSPAVVKIEAITQVGLVVTNLEEVVRNYWELMGFGPWEIYEHQPPVIHNRLYHGKPGDFTMKVALASAGSIQIELVQPLSGNSIYDDFIKEHGGGLHHLQFLVKDLDETTELMNKQGFPTLMSGRVADGGFAYFDTVKPLKCIWEACQPRRPLPPVGRYP